MAIALHKEIQEWLLDDSDFERGKSLFCQIPQYSKSSEWVLIKSGETSLSRRKLRQMLEKVISGNSIAAAPAKEKTIVPAPQTQGAKEEEVRIAPISKKPQHKLGDTAGYPAHLIDLDRETYFNLVRLDKLRAESLSIPEGRQLHLHAIERVQIDRQIARAYEELNYFAANLKVMPGTEPETKMEEIARLMRALKINPPYISKNRKNTNADVIAEVAKRQAELDQAEEFINKYLPK